MEKMKYYAFISYQREDEKWAKWLQNKLDNYLLPTSICKQNTELPKKLYPNFRDKTDLRPDELKAEIKRHLDLSRHLIVICSPGSAQSEWVGTEIQHFIDTGRQKNIILLIVEGIPYSNEIDTECIHPVLIEQMPEILGANINEEGQQRKYIKKERAFVQVVARMLDVEFETLWQRQRRRRKRKMILNTSISISFIMSCILIWLINSSFDIQIKLSEKTQPNKNLKFKKSKLYLILDKDTRELNVDSLNQDIVFRDIAAKYRRKDIRLCFSSYGYNDVDTVLAGKKETYINLYRDNTYSNVKGVVRSEKTDEFLSGVSVIIEDIEVITNEKGYFEFIIPLEKQREEYKALLKYENRIDSTQEAYPTENTENLINTLYI